MTVSGRIKNLQATSPRSKPEKGERNLTPSTGGDVFTELQNARVMVRALSQTLDNANRLRLANSFGVALVRSWWEASCADQSISMDLRRPSSDFSAFPLDDTLKGLAALVGQLSARLDPAIAAYQIGLTYTYLLPSTYRSSYGIHYTPPALAHRLIHLATAANVDWSTCRVLDPSCGGGAFLAPVAQHVIAQLPGCSPRILLENIANRLRGYEIDPFGAWLAQVAVDIVLLPLSSVAGKKTPALVTLCDSLEKDPPRNRFDLVIGNPPYSRTRLTPVQREKFRRSLYGHANLYGVFTDLALRHVRPGGVVAFVTPTSFLAGKYFRNLRALLGREAPPQHLDFVADRSRVFDDVLQETLLAAYRRGATWSPVVVHELDVSGAKRLEANPLGAFKLPVDPSLPWILPRKANQIRTARAAPHRRHFLNDWGYTVSTGPLVWNRFKDQIHARMAKCRLPLIWAEAVLPNGHFEWRARKHNHEPWFEVRAGENWLVTREPCVLLQRTTAKEQHRRLIAAPLPESFIAQHGGVVVENHLNMLKPLASRPHVPPAVLATVLNSHAADRAFRCMSGSVAVSAYEIEALPLPAPEKLDRLQGLIAANMSHRMVEDECRRLFEG